jgi:glutamate 5-kinase
MATSAGIPVVICNGTEPGTLERAVAGEAVGTRFLPQQRRQSSFKLWLRYAKSSRGAVLVDAGAERALRDQGTSLLPVGIVEVQGEFEAGDAVDVLSAGDGRRAIGKGISNLSAEDLRRVKGLKSSQVREVLPRASEEAVHRDYFVLA